MDCNHTNLPMAAARTEKTKDSPDPLISFYLHNYI
jgi:hypothetical protein